MKQPSAIFYNVRQLVRATVALVLTAWTLPGFAAPDWDIIGIKLGMTEAEVREALKAFDPKAKITAYNATFRYHDGVSSHQTPEFLNTIEMGELDNGIKAWFSGPIGDARVIGITRNHFDGSRSAPTLAQFEQSLQGKYKNSTGQFENANPLWEEAGKPSCIRIIPGPTRAHSQSRPDLGPFSVAAQPRKNPDDIENTLEKSRHRVSKGLLPKDLATCGAFMFYKYYRGDPVNRFTAGIFDLGAMIATERSRNAWVDKLEAEATRKRQGQGQAPRL